MQAYKLLILTLINLIVILQYNMPLSIGTWVTLMFLDVVVILIINKIFGGVS